MDITKWTALKLGRLIRAGEVSVVEVVQAYLDSIEKKDGIYHAYLSVWKEQALRRARQVQQELAAGRYVDSPLAGVPIAIKDNICTKGEETTCASRMLTGFRPPYDAEVIKRLLHAGMVIVGKTNMDEFAMGSTTETSAAGVTRNPWDISRVPGGSSGGSAAAVAAFEAPIALGSDTGGSIRQPSSFCGVTGIKPTYGTVSRYGLIAYASSLDQIGPIARSVEDLAAVLEIISGWDEKDSTSIPPDYKISKKRRELSERTASKQYHYLDVIEELKREHSPKPLFGLRIGMPEAYFGEGLDRKVKEQVLQAAEVLKELGAEVEEFDLPAVRYAVPAYYVLASAEASSNLSRYDGVKYGYRASGYKGLQELYQKTRSEGFGEEVKRRILIGTFVLSSGYYDAYYNKALKVRTIIKQGFDQAFERYDMLLGPTVPTVAPKLGESLSEPLKMYLGDSDTVAVNLAGLPGISIPVGFAGGEMESQESGLPVGMQLIGKPFGERVLLKAAYAYEMVQGWESERTKKAGRAEGRE